MGVEHQYGNLETYEYIDLGKCSVRNPSLWTDMYYDFIRGEIDTSLIGTYLKEYYPKYNGDDHNYVEWIARNIAKFLDKTGNNVVHKSDDIVVLPDETIMLCDEMTPPFYIEGPLISTPEIENPWKEVWSRYRRATHIHS
jgi:hypothetical protein